MFVYFFLLECVCIIHIENMLTYLNSDEKGISGNRYTGAAAEKEVIGSI